MKTITEVARDLGVSRQTLYNVIDKADNVDIESLTKGRRGKARLFDEKSESIVKELLSKYCQNNANEKQVDNKLDNKKKEIEDLRRALTEAEERIKTLTTEAERLTAKLEQVEEDNRILIRTNATNAVTIQKLQEREQKKLAEAAAEDRGGSWIKRTIRKITGKGKEQKE